MCKNSVTACIRISRILSSRLTLTPRAVQTPQIAADASPPRPQSPPLCSWPWSYGQTCSLHNGRHWILVEFLRLGRDLDLCLDLGLCLDHLKWICPTLAHPLSLSPSHSRHDRPDCQTILATIPSPVHVKFKSRLPCATCKSHGQAAQTTIPAHMHCDNHRPHCLCIHHRYQSAPPVNRPSAPHISPDSVPHRPRRAAVICIGRLGCRSNKFQRQRHRTQCPRRVGRHCSRRKLCLRPKVKSLHPPSPPRPPLEKNPKSPRAAHTTHRTATRRISCTARTFHYPSRCSISTYVPACALFRIVVPCISLKHAKQLCPHYHLDRTHRHHQHLHVSHTQTIRLILHMTRQKLSMRSAATSSLHTSQLSWVRRNSWYTTSPLLQSNHWSILVWRWKPRSHSVIFPLLKRGAKMSRHLCLE